MSDSKDEYLKGIMQHAAPSQQAPEERGTPQTDALWREWFGSAERSYGVGASLTLRSVWKHADDLERRLLAAEERLVTMRKSFELSSTDEENLLRAQLAAARQDRDDVGAIRSTLVAILCPDEETEIDAEGLFALARACRLAYDNSAKLMAEIAALRQRLEQSKLEKAELIAHYEREWNADAQEKVDLYNAEVAKVALLSLQWKPIDAAPRTGEAVIVWAPSNHWQAVTTFWSFKDQAWMDLIGNKFTPTHWMPLPSGPQAALAAEPPAGQEGKDG